MLPGKKYRVCLMMLLASCTFLPAQQTIDEKAAQDTIQTNVASPVFVEEIIITGNKKTKSTVILREIPFQIGRAYLLDELVKMFEDARRQLMNTTLFHTVVVAAKKFDGNKVSVAVEVKERWYLFPIPYLKPVDRNLNQWLIEQKASLNRVNYGIKLLYNNATGTNDKLRLSLGSGYTRQLSFSYDRLYIDKKMKWGLNAVFAYGKNREINYNTIADKQVFIKNSDQYLRNFVSAIIGLSYRKAINTRHQFGFGYNSERVNDTVVLLNPSYFKEGRNSVRFPWIYYTMTYYNLDYIPYPTKGYAAQIFVGKSGFDKVVNLFQLSAKGSASWPISKKAFVNLNAYGGLKLPFKQPYFTRRFLGYGDVFMQGYEYYVVDGVAGGYLKTTLTKEIFNFNIRIPPIKKGKEAQRIPFRIFAKMFGNAGYVHNPEPGENALSNKMLYSGGIGIDILSFYDVTFKLEWTFNQLGQNGIFIHRKTIF